MARPVSANELVAEKTAVVRSRRDAPPTIPERTFTRITACLFSLVRDHSSPGLNGEARGHKGVSGGKVTAGLSQSKYRKMTAVCPSAEAVTATGKEVFVAAQKVTCPQLILVLVPFSTIDWTRLPATPVTGVPATSPDPTMWARVRARKLKTSEL
jgi:hypothetical protein